MEHSSPSFLSGSTGEAAAHTLSYALVSEFGQWSDHQLLLMCTAAIINIRKGKQMETFSPCNGSIYRHAAESGLVFMRHLCIVNQGWSQVLRPFMGERYINFYFANAFMLISCITFIGCNIHGIFLLYIQYKHSLESQHFSQVVWTVQCHDANCVTCCHVQILLLLGTFANMYVFLKIQYVESIRVFILKGIMSFLQKMKENI